MSISSLPETPTIGVPTATSTRLYNADLAPVTKRNWGVYNFFAMWMQDIHSITVYTFAASLFFMGLNGGPDTKPSQAVSFMVETADQAETDRLWQAIVGHGGRESDCGWCQDRWGLSWQITPRVLIESVTDPDPAVARRVFQAMMTMRKIDVAAIEAARRG